TSSFGEWQNVEFTPTLESSMASQDVRFHPACADSDHERFLGRTCMIKRILYVMTGLLLVVTAGLAQRISDPYPEPIPATDRVIAVKFVEFATIPDFVGPPAAPRGGGEAVTPAPAPPRIMTML